MTIETLHEGLKNIFGTAALSTALALGSGTAQAQDNTNGSNINKQTIETPHNSEKIAEKDVDKIAMALIKKEEGLRLKVYKDKDGWAIGYGHQVNQNQPDITLEQAESFFATDYNVAKNAVKKVFKRYGLNWDNINPAAKVVTTSLSYQLGEYKFSKWEHTIKAFGNHDMNTAIKEIQSSKLATPAQTPNRVNRLIELLKNKS